MRRVRRTGNDARSVINKKLSYRKQIARQRSAAHTIRRGHQ